MIHIYGNTIFHIQPQFFRDKKRRPARDRTASFFPCGALQNPVFSRLVLERYQDLINLCRYPPMGVRTRRDVICASNGYKRLKDVYSKISVWLSSSTVTFSVINVLVVSQNEPRKLLPPWMGDSKKYLKIRLKVVSLDFHHFYPAGQRCLAERFDLSSWWVK